MSDPMIPTRDTNLKAPFRSDGSEMDSEAVQRLTARLATLDLDPPTAEILTAVLTAGIDVDRGGADS